MWDLGSQLPGSWGWFWTNVVAGNQTQDKEQFLHQVSSRSHFIEEHQMVMVPREQN